MLNADPHYPVIDCFILRTLTRCNLTFRSLALEQYNSLRRSGAYRTKAWCVPGDSTVQTPFNDSFESQVFMQPGSAIWGYSFTGESDPTETIDSFQVREACTDVPLFSEFVTHNIGGGFGFRQNLLSQLLVVPEPGLLTVEIATVSLPGFPRNHQLILWGGEPAWN